MLAGNRTFDDLLDGVVAQHLTQGRLGRKGKNDGAAGPEVVAPKRAHRFESKPELASRVENALGGRIHHPGLEEDGDGAIGRGWNSIATGQIGEPALFG